MVHNMLVNKRFEGIAERASGKLERYFWALPEAAVSRSGDNCNAPVKI